jgi:hypothetical protein
MNFQTFNNCCLTDTRFTMKIDWKLASFPNFHYSLYIKGPHFRQFYQNIVYLTLIFDFLFVLV